MRKKKQIVTPLRPLNPERLTLTWAHSNTCLAMDLVSQMETTARLISSTTDGGAIEHEPTDIHHLMSLFQQQLEQVSNLIDEVQVIMEEVDPSIKKAANA